MRVTPPLQATGVYVLRDPWSVPDNIIYRCMAVRTIPELREAGIDPFAEFYVKYGRTKEDYDSDVAQGVTIVTLLSDRSETVQVPDTYIVKFPFEEIVPYDRVVLSINLGAIPAALPLAMLQAKVSAVCSDVIGVEAPVRIHSAPSLGAVTPAQDKLNTLAREAAIKDRTTDRAKLILAEQKIARLEALVKQYERQAILAQTKIE